MEEPEVAHGASRCANVEGIPWSDKNDTQTVGIGVGKHGDEFTAGKKQRDTAGRQSLAWAARGNIDCGGWKKRVRPPRRDFLPLHGTVVVGEGHRSPTPPLVGASSHR